MAFLDDNYLLSSPAAEKIFAALARLPIVDPHNHANVREIADNHNYHDVWQLLAATDHYIWSLMRRAGVDEAFITGSRSAREKFLELARVFPDFAGNPVYEWVHLDLQRCFGIDTVLNAQTGAAIFEAANAKISRPEMKPVQILKNLNVVAMCSTDDPVDLLEDHRRANALFGKTVIRPTWRPDAAYNIQRPDFSAYIQKLGTRFGKPITRLDDLRDALRQSHDYFAANNCVVSDHGVEVVPLAHGDAAQAAQTFARALAGQELDAAEIANYHAVMFGFTGELDAEKNWVFQLHFGAVRNVRAELFARLGNDCGGDVGNMYQDHQPGLFDFLNRFDNRLKIALYCFDPGHLSTVASTARAFGSQVRIGAPWWQCDNPIGMKRQLEYFGSVDLLSCCSGMVSDSRKLLSYGSRHEMFRRVLADVLGNMAELGQAPADVLEGLAIRMALETPRKFFAI